MSCVCATLPKQGQSADRALVSSHRATARRTGAGEPATLSVPLRVPTQDKRRVLSTVEPGRLTAPERRKELRSKAWLKMANAARGAEPSPASRLPSPSAHCCDVPELHELDALESRAPPRGPTPPGGAGAADGSGSHSGSLRRRDHDGKRPPVVGQQRPKVQDGDNVNRALDRSPLAEAMDRLGFVPLDILELHRELHVLLQVNLS